MSRQLADLLAKDKIISPVQLAESEAYGSNVIRALIDKKYISETRLLYYLSQKFGLPSINLDKFDINRDVIALVSVDLARKHQVIPIQTNNKGTLVVALCDPTQLEKLEPLRFAMKLNIETVLTSFTAFDTAFSRYYRSENLVNEAIETYQKDAKKERDKDAAEDLGGTSVNIELVQIHDIQDQSVDQDAPVITLVNGILGDAIRKKASDIHVESYEKRCRVRMRMDGTLIETLQIPNEMKRAVVARLKIMARMDIGESRVPQDGRIKLRMGQTEIDFRVNSLPTLFGEKVVLRLLSKGNLQLDLSKMGFDTQQLELFRKGIYSASGMVLVTGPTGSGKTTTLYSAITELNKQSDNISTAEEPVEYNFEGINQVEVNKDVGLTYATVLRAMLRQDPDIILVGEIRDYETAETAIQAALTGHLVLSTLHTNDAPATIVRLVNMGIEPFLLTACLNVVVAQRLLRLICPKCKEQVMIPHPQLLELGFTPEALKTLKIYKGAGCQNCNRTGYRGRAAIYELLEMTPGIRELVLAGATQAEIKQCAVQEGMKSLRFAALAKVAQGTTTLEEALSNTMEG